MVRSFHRVFGEEYIIARDVLRRSKKKTKANVFQKGKTLQQTGPVSPSDGEFADLAQQVISNSCRKGKRRKKEPRYVSTSEDRSLLNFVKDEDVLELGKPPDATAYFQRINVKRPLVSVVDVHEVRGDTDAGRSETPSVAEEEEKPMGLQDMAVKKREILKKTKKPSGGGTGSELVHLSVPSKRSQRTKRVQSVQGNRAEKGDEQGEGRGKGEKVDTGNKSKIKGEVVTKEEASKDTETPLTAGIGNNLEEGEEKNLKEKRTTTPENDAEVEDAVSTSSEGVELAPFGKDSENPDREKGEESGDESESSASEDEPKNRQSGKNQDESRDGGKSAEEEGEEEEVKGGEGSSGESDDGEESCLKDSPAGEDDEDNDEERERPKEAM